MGASLRKHQVLVSRNPTDSAAWYGLGRALLTRKDVEKSKLAFREAIQHAKSGERDAAVCAAIGELLASVQLNADAIAAFRKAIALGHSDSNLVLNLGHLLLQSGEPEAVCQLLRGEEGSNEIAEHQDLLSRAQEAAGDFESALETLDVLVARHPGSLDLLQRYGRLSARLGHHEVAARSFREIVAVTQGANLDALMSLGIALSDLGDHEEALIVLGEVVGRAPNRAEAHANLGTAYLAMGDAHSAAEPLSNAVRLDPSSAQAQCMLGAAYQLLGRHQEAAERFRFAVQAAPQWHVPHYNYGTVLMELGNFEQARGALTKAANLAPGDPDISDAIARLEQESHSSRGPGGRAQGMTGDLESFKLPELLEFLRMQRSTGTLAVSARQGAGLLRLSAGSLTGASGSSTRRLGELLIERGLVEPQQLDRVLAAQQASAKRIEEPEYIGELLIREGLVQPPSLREALGDQLIVALREMMGWNSGNFAFHREETAREAPSWLVFDVQSMLLEAARQIDETQR